MDGAVLDDALMALRAAVDGLLTVDCAAVPPLKLAELLTDMEAQRRRLEAVDVRVIAGLAVQATPAQFGAVSTPDLVAGLTRVSRGEARARVQRSIDLAPRRALSGEPLDPVQPRTAEALTAGEISGAHAALRGSTADPPGPRRHRTPRGAAGTRPVFRHRRAPRPPPGVRVADRRD